MGYWRICTGECSHAIEGCAATASRDIWPICQKDRRDHWSHCNDGHAHQRPRQGNDHSRNGRDSQADYEKMMTDSAAKRAADSKLVSEKEAAKAETAASLEAHKETKVATMKELDGTVEMIKALHSDCDWLVEMFDVRKEARAGEVASLKNA